MNLTKKLGSAIIIGTMAFSLVGCGDKKDDSAITDSAKEAFSLQGIYNVLGLDDSDVVAIYGEGDAQKDGDELYNRTIDATLSEGKAMLNISYVDNKVSAVSIVFEDDNDTIKASLIAAFGETENLNDESEGNDMLVWDIDRTEVFYSVADGQAQVVMSLFSEEDVVEPSEEVEVPEEGKGEEPPANMLPSMSTTPSDSNKPADTPSKPSTTPSNPPSSATSDVDLSEMMSKILANVKDMPAVMDVPISSDDFEYYTFIDYVDGYKALASEGALSSVAHSVVLVQVPQGTDVNKVADSIKANANPRKWVCVEAEKTIVSVKGNTILLVMSFEDLADEINKNFLALK